jgi:hypothetical protein
MTSKIILESEKDYILVEPKAGNYWEICECLGRELKVPEYPDKNAIWSFPDVPLKLIYDELYKIREILCNNYPKNANPDRKVAIVVQTGLHMALAKEYVKIVEDLPIKFQLFSDLSSAEEWVSGHC